MKLTYRPILFVVPAMGLAGCSGSPTASPSDLLSDPQATVVGDSVFLLSPAAGAVIRVTPGTQGAQPYSDLEDVQVDAIHVGSGPQRLMVTPDHSRLLVLNHEGNQHSLAVIDTATTCTGESPVDAGCVTALEARPLHDTLVVSPDSRYALSYISPGGADLSQEDVINLNEVGVYDLVNGQVSFAPLGFDPQDFAFTGADPTQPRVVALTSSQVVALNLADPTQLVTRELTLGTDTQQEPKQVVITADDHFALVTIKGSADLFTFDLTQSTLPINILSLSGTPGAMALSASGEETLVLADGGYELDIIHHSDFSIDVFELEEAADTILAPPGTEYAVLYNSSGSSHYLQYVDLSADRVQAYLLDNPCQEVMASPGGEALVIFYVPDSYDGSDSLSNSYAVAILNLAAGDRKPNPILVTSYPAGAVFADAETADADQRVFVPINSWDHGLVARLNLTTYDSTVVETPPDPMTIGRLETDGRVVVVHSAAAGLISIFPEEDPASIQFVSGFMLQDMF